jgi:hypothetical protein
MRESSAARRRGGRVALLAALALGFCLGWSAASNGLAQDAPEFDFRLEETSGQMRTMREARGRIVVVFYEDRAHSSDNDAFKHELYRFVQDNHLEARMRTYAIADVRGVEGVMRDMARAAIRGIASRYGIQLLLDWDGSLQSAPWSFADGAANVMLFDAHGQPAWRHTGTLGASQRSEFYRALRAHLRR